MKHIENNKVQFEVITNDVFVLVLFYFYKIILIKCHSFLQMPLLLDGKFKMTPNDPIDIDKVIKSHTYFVILYGNVITSW